MAVNLVNIIFGMKLRQARQEKGLSLSAFAEKCELSASYLTEIEKGRKYPRNDKILRMAHELGKEYDELVSVSLDPSLSHLESALSSSMLQGFPFDEFGLEAGDLFNLLTRVPDKTSALVHALLGIGRHYDLLEEDFLRAALRSYQELHDNHFEDLEEAAMAFADEHPQAFRPTPEAPVAREALETILREQYGYQIHGSLLHEHPVLHTCRTVYVQSDQPHLLTNARLSPRQHRFVMARELGYQYLGLRERSPTSTPLRIDSFDQILNDFKAAYFAGAILIPGHALLEDLQTFFRFSNWKPDGLLRLLDRYAITPEMLLYRCSELIPAFFGFKMHVLRLHRRGDSFQLTKHLNMDRLMAPSGIGLNEHFCRRWLPVRLLSDLNQRRHDVGDGPVAGIQVSDVLDTDERFLSIGFARPLRLTCGVDSSISVGFALDAEVRRSIRFAEDPAIPRLLIHETCERCPLTPVQCADRAAEPLVLRRKQVALDRRLALHELTDAIAAGDLTAAAGPSRPEGSTLRA